MACGQAGESGRETPDDAEGFETLPSAAAPDSTPRSNPDSVVIPGGRASPPWPGPGTLPDTTLRVGRLLLTNVGEAPLVIRASAGAAEVILDTVRARDSALVEVRVRADTLQLRALDASGRERARGRLAIHPDSTRRWVVP